MNKPINIRLHAISPIHIGCDDVYEPTSFIIDDKKKKLVEFDQIEFISALNSKEIEEFNKISAGDNLLAIFKMIKRLYKPAVKGKEVEVTNFLIEHYKNILNMGTFDKKAVINQFIINKTAYNIQNKNPYIPGSSIKGSLRTAYLSDLANIKGIKGYFKDKRNKEFAINKELEVKLLGGSFNTDPFRLVKVSDLLPVENINTKIVYAVNKKKKKSDKDTLADKGGIYQIFEVIQQGTIFEGTLKVDNPLEVSEIKHPVNAENMLLSAHRFYAGNLAQEANAMHEALGIKHMAGIYGNARFKDRFKQDAFLVRIGRHSGAEAVTIEGNRNIKIMQGKEKNPLWLDHSTTFWLASEEPRPESNANLIPFGWAVIEVVN